MNDDNLSSLVNNVRTKPEFFLPKNRRASRQVSAYALRSAHPSSLPRYLIPCSHSLYVGIHCIFYSLLLYEHCSPPLYHCSLVLLLSAHGLHLTMYGKMLASHIQHVSSTHHHWLTAALHYSLAFARPSSIVDWGCDHRGLSNYSVRNWLLAIASMSSLC